jgi:Bacteroidetes VLRF1 release factor/Vms1-associating treble clef domain/Ankyrin repeat
MSSSSWVFDLAGELSHASFCRIQEGEKVIDLVSDTNTDANTNNTTENVNPTGAAAPAPLSRALHRQTSEYVCTTCDARFAQTEQHRSHYQTEWHRINVKRAAQDDSVEPLTLEQVEQYQTSSTDAKSHSVDPSSSSSSISAAVAMSTVASSTGTSTAAAAASTAKHQLKLTPDQFYDSDEYEPVDTHDDDDWFDHRPRRGGSKKNGSNKNNRNTTAGHYSPDDSDEDDRLDAAAGVGLAGSSYIHLVCEAHPSKPNMHHVYKVWKNVVFHPSLRQFDMNIDLLSCSEALRKLPQTAQQTCVIMSSGGHFAAGIFQGKKCIEKKSFHRYITRRKQGGMQSTFDSTGGGKARSVGSSIRRHNQLMLETQISDLLLSWKDQIDACQLVFVYAPSVNMRWISAFDGSPVNRADPRVRSVPMYVSKVNHTRMLEVHRALLTIECLDMTWQQVQLLTRRTAAQMRHSGGKSHGDYAESDDLNGPDVDVDVDDDDDDYTSSEDDMDDSKHVMEDLTPEQYAELHLLKSTAQWRSDKCVSLRKAVFSLCSRSTVDLPILKALNTCDISPINPGSEQLISTIAQELPEMLVNHRALAAHDECKEAAAYDPLDTLEDIAMFVWIPLIQHRQNDCLSYLIDTAASVTYTEDEEEYLTDIDDSIAGHIPSISVNMQLVASNMQTLLFFAARAGNIEAIELLLAYGADPMLRDSSNRVAYNACKDKPTRMAFRIFAGQYPDMHDWVRASIQPCNAEELGRAQAQRRAESDRLANSTDAQTIAAVATASATIAKKRKKKKKKKKKNKSKTTIGSNETDEEESGTACSASPDKKTDNLNGNQKQKQKKKKKPKLSAAEIAAEEARLAALVASGELQACSFCNKAITKIPFERLHFFYCSIDCVQLHRQELG